MVYWDNDPLPPLSVKLPPYEPETEEPTDEVRAHVRAILEEHPKWIRMPHRLASWAQRKLGVELPVKQIAGALAEIRAEGGGC